MGWLRYTSMLGNSDDVSRRSVLKTSGIAAAASLAGCIGGGGGGSNFKPTDAAEFPISDVESTFNIWNWYEGHAEYAAEEMPGTYENLETVNVSGFSSPTEWFSKLQSGQHSIDLAVASTNIADQAMKNDLSLAQPVDALPNYDNVSETARSAMEESFEKDGDIYASPTAIGVTGALGYHTDVMDKPDSWEVLWDSEYEGQLTMQDDAYTAGFIGARYTGQDWTDPSDWDDIEEALIQQKPLNKTYWQSFETGMQMFINKEVVAGQMTVGRLFSARFNHDTPTVDYSIPKEGAKMFLEEHVIPKGAPHPKIATEYLHWYYKPENAMKMFTILGYLPPLSNLGQHMDDHDVPQEQRKFATRWQDSDNPVIFGLPLDEEVREKYNEVWSNVKAA